MNLPVNVDDENRFGHRVLENHLTRRQNAVVVVDAFFHSFMFHYYRHLHPPATAGAVRAST